MNKLEQKLNNFAQLSYIPYNIVKYLANDENANGIFKILKYNTTDCLSKPNLSFEEKMGLIWTGDDPNQEDFNIFLTRKTEDFKTEAKTILKIYKFMLKPTTQYEGISVYNFDLIMKGKIDNVYFNGILCNRLDVLEQMLLSSLNGIDVGGTGSFKFSSTMSNYCNSMASIGDNKTVVGTSISLAVKIVNIGTSQSCD